MSRADRILGRTLRRLITTQLVLLAIAAAVAAATQGLATMLALLFGGAVTIASSLAGAGRIYMAAALPGEAVTMQVAALYKSAVLKLLTAITLLALGLGYFELAPLPMLVGLAVTQISYLLTRSYGA
ncbi:MAG: hypothetical protein AMS22_02675 [Thiotrichales bacterium SG8_50]|nr:MAG: hypothetical protein AMS22_02675 [Thiotrichales bacterium SG8_50]